MQPRAAYVHVPFCAHRCGYCNFTLVAGRDDLIEAYLEAIERELSWLERPRPVDTLFFGGGTPTHLPPAALRRLFDSVLRWFVPTENCELSVEANPIDVDRPMVDLLVQHGVTRLSIGAQSLNADKLKTLERDHTAEHIGRAAELCRAADLAIAIDLIFGVPGESPEVWRADLQGVLELQPDHVSTYGLTFEKGTAFWGRLQREELSTLEEETERAMYAEAIRALTARGMEHYEVSNFARPGKRCRHNEVYWSGGSYFGVGPGAARHIAGRRETNHRSTTTYLRRVLDGQSPVAESEMLDGEAKARETLVFALRKLEGVGRAAFMTQTGFDIDALVDEPLRRFVELGFLATDGDRIRLTREGLFISDSIWPHFLDPAGTS